MKRPLFRAIKRMMVRSHGHRFSFLLVALFFLLITAPMLEALGLDEQISYGAVSTVFILALMAAMFALARSRPVVLVGTAILLMVAGASIAEVLHPTLAVGVFRDLVAALLLFWIMVLGVRYLLTTKLITMNTIAASLCIFLLIGMFWAQLYAIVATLDPNAFKAPIGDEGLLTLADPQTGDALYYSYVTLSTLGYGDITPAAPAAKVLAATEAVVGQLFLVVLVARLVGMHISLAAVRAAQETARRDERSRAGDPRDDV